MKDEQYLKLHGLVQHMVGKIRELEGEIHALQAILLKKKVATHEELTLVRQKARNVAYDPDLGMTEVVSGKDPAELVVMPQPDK